MSLFETPNVEKMEAMRDVEGLIITLGTQQRGTARERAAETLGRIGDARAVEPLIAALEHGYQDLREAAARALGQLGDPRVVEPLIAAFKDDKDRKVHEAVVEAFGKICAAGSNAADAIIEFLQRSSGGYHDQQLAYLLIEFGVGKAAPVLKMMLDRRDFHASSGHKCGDDYVEHFLQKNKQFLAEYTVKEVVCSLCGKTKPITEARNYNEMWFCTTDCWPNRGKIIINNYGRTCPKYKVGMCILGDGTNLCALKSGSYITCFMYNSFSR